MANTFYCLQIRIQDQEEKVPYTHVYRHSMLQVQKEQCLHFSIPTHRCSNEPLQCRGLVLVPAEPTDVTVFEEIAASANNKCQSAPLGASGLLPQYILSPTPLYLSHPTPELMFSVISRPLVLSAPCALAYHSQIKISKMLL